MYHYFQIKHITFILLILQLIHLQACNGKWSISTYFDGKNYGTLIKDLVNMKFFDKVSIKKIFVFGTLNFLS